MLQMTGYQLTNAGLSEAVTRHTAAASRSMLKRLEESCKNASHGGCFIRITKP